MGTFNVDDKVRVKTWYDPTEVGRIRAVNVGGVGFYDVAYDDGEELLAVPPHVISLAPAPPAPADALREQMRDVVAALKPLAAAWRGYEEYRAYFEDKHEFFDAPLNILDWLAIDAAPETAMPMQAAFKAAADALAKLEDGTHDAG